MSLEMMSLCTTISLYHTLCDEYQNETFNAQNNVNTHTHPQSPLNLDNMANRYNPTCQDRRYRVIVPFLGPDGENIDFNAVCLVPGANTIVTNITIGMHLPLDDPLFHLGPAAVDGLMMALGREYESYTNMVQHTTLVCVRKTLCVFSRLYLFAGAPGPPQEWHSTCACHLRSVPGRTPDVRGGLNPDVRDGKDKQASLKLT